MTATRADVLAREHVVYRVYGKLGRLLYVGCTSNLVQRQRDHRQWALWYRPSIRYVTEGPFDYATARRVELAAIRAENPAGNRTGRFVNSGARRGRRVSS